MWGVSPPTFRTISDANHSLDAAYAANPARFRHRRPHPPKLPSKAWINDPSPEALIKNE